MDKQSDRPASSCAEVRHPGELLRQHVLAALHLSVSQAARDLAITRQALHRILAGDAAITPEMAIRLERLCGVSSRFWLSRQCEYELPRAKVGMAAQLKRIPARPLSKTVIEQIEATYGQ